jgi:hypothetical protein
VIDGEGVVLDQDGNSIFDRLHSRIAAGPRKANLQTHAAQQVGDDRPARQPV